MDRPVSGAEITRVTIIESAIRLFGERGYDAVSTREIADLAAANLGSIAYHFGGKPGLRKACAEYVIAHIHAIVGPTLLRPMPKLNPDEATDTILRLLDTFSRFWIANPDSQNFVNFMIRELIEPGDVSDILYKNWMKPVHMRFCALFGLSTGLDPESEEVKLAVFCCISQIFHFRIGRPLIMRRMEWEELGEKEVGRVAEGFQRNAAAIIAAYRRI